MIEELSIQCGRDVMSRRVFFFFSFFSRVSPPVPLIAGISHIMITLSSPLSFSSSSSSLPAETCYQAFVGVKPDASETRSGYLLQLPRTQRSGETLPDTYMCTHH